MNPLKLGSAILLAGLLATTACSAGTKDEADKDSVKINSGSDVEDDTTTTTAAEDEDEGEGEATEEEAPEGALLLIMDASGSMNEDGSDGKPLLEGAKSALHGLVDSLPDGLHTGLRVFGHRYPNTDKTNGCKDTELISPVEPLDRDALDEAIDGYEAKGFTPIGLSLEEGAKDLPPEGPRTIVLVSDGDDTCDSPDPCEVAEQLRADGVELIINTVGFALGDNQAARDQLTCIADAGGGQFYDVEDAGQLATTLEDVGGRESRRFETAGQTIEGAPVPRDANTGEINTAHTDTILGKETNYYRFEIEPGSTVKAEVAIAAAGDPATAHPADYLYYEVSLVNGDDADYSWKNGSIHVAESGIVNTDAVTVDADEVWIKIESSEADMGTGYNELPVPVELHLTVD